LLRAKVAVIDGEPVHQVNARQGLDFEQEDAEEWSDAALRHRLIHEAEHPIAIESEPVLRVRLFTRAARGHVLLLAVHHIVADMWSLALLLRELGELYDAFISGVAPALNVDTPYGDFVNWQRRMLSGLEGRKLRAYWERQLADIPLQLNLPMDRSPGRVHSDRGASLDMIVSAVLSRRLEELGGRLGTTLYVTLLAAFGVLLQRYTRQNDILVGSPAAGRTRAWMRSMIGYFVNPLPIRIEFSGDPHFEDLHRRVRRTVLGAMRRQDYPFILVSEQLLAGQKRGRTASLPAMFIMQTRPPAADEPFMSFVVG
jgi:hypothetical protein